MRFDTVAASCFLLLLAAAALAKDNQPPAKAFEEWMTKYGRTYKDPIEKEKRFKIFKENLRQIQEFDKNGNATYTLGLNKFADMTNKEFLASRLRYMPPKTGENFTSDGVPFVGKVPTSINWVKKGAVNPVLNQGNCECAWAYSAAAAVEGIIKIKTKKLPKLSEQQLLDCDPGEYTPSGAFSYITQNGITYSSSYNVDKKCAGFFPVVKIRGYKTVRVSETELMKAVAIQPVSIAVDVNLAWQFYTGGVFTGYCGNAVNHPAIIVGYGKTSSGIKYWLVKNSWGTNWGENGYIRMQKDTGIPGGLCGIAQLASYPIA